MSDNLSNDDQNEPNILPSGRGQVAKISHLIQRRNRGEKTNSTRKCPPRSSEVHKFVDRIQGILFISAFLFCFRCCGGFSQLQTVFRLLAISDFLLLKAGQIELKDLQTLESELKICKLSCHSMFTNENIKTYLFKDNVDDNHYLDLGSVAVMALSFVAILFDFWLNPEFKESLKKAMHEKTMSIYSFLVILARLFAVLAFACTVSAISKPFLGVLERSLQTTLQVQIQQALPFSTECSAPPQFPDLFPNAPNMSEFGKIIRRIGDPRELPWNGSAPDGWISLNDKYFVSSRDPTHPTLTYLLLSISKLFIQGELHVIKIKYLEAQLQALEKANNKNVEDINAVNITWEKNNQTIANQLQALEKANNKNVENVNAVNITWEKNNQTIANQLQAWRKPTIRMSRTLTL